MTKGPIKVAAAQSFISKDVRENGKEIRVLMTKAAHLGARVVNFPEGAMSGYVKAQIWDWQDVDWELLQNELDATRQLAKKLGIWVALGSNHRLSPPNRPHNSIYIISDEGKIIDRYDKKWCSYTETNDWYTPGNSLTTFEVDGWTFGCAICVEIQFPEHFLAYGVKGIDCMLYSVYKDSPMFGVQAQAYAATNNYWFSISNACQQTKELQSQMIGPNGEIQSRCNANESTFCVSELNYDASEYDIALKKARPWRSIVRTTDFYSSRFVSDERSENKTSF